MGDEFKDNLVINALNSMTLFACRVVDYSDEKSKLICQRYINGGEYQQIEVFKPYVAGAGGAGFFMTPEIGSTLICARVPQHPEQTICITTLPNEYQATTSLDKKRPPAHTPVNNGVYPKTDKNTTVIQGKSGFLKFNKETIEIGNNFGQGISATKDRVGTNIVSNATNKSSHTEGGYSIEGEVKRISAKGLKQTFAKSNNLNNIDKDQIRKSKAIGIFPKTRVKQISTNGLKKNFARTEFRKVINQYNQGFKGFDQEVDFVMKNGTAKSSEDSRMSLAQNQNNILNLAPNQLIEIIAGNVVTPKGEVLDSNFEPLLLGSQGRVPSEDLKNKFLETKEIERRSLGYIFQLDTNNNSNDYSDNRENFVTAISKEGFLTLNIPKTSDTGIVFKNNKIQFWDGNNGTISKSDINFSQDEVIPITTINENSVYPRVPISYGSAEEGRRVTGVFHKNINSFKIGKEDETSEERVYPTKHHNMAAAGEMLFANYIKEIQIPEFWNNPNSGYPEGIPTYKFFEILNNDLTPLNDSVNSPKSYMTTVGITPSAPAIDPGFDDKNPNVYCGMNEQNVSNGAYTNDFEFQVEDNNNKKASPKFEDGTLRTGGKSANINLEGSLEASIGKDNKDQKSLLLDMAGSMVAWLGKDSNGRSLVMQTDGAIAINVGGHDQEGNLLPGRFDLRVNVTDKGNLSDPEVVGSGKDVSDSDYIISIGEHGLLIAGMSKEKLLIRNKGDVCIESSEGEVVLSGFSGVKYREGMDAKKDLNLSPSEKNARENPEDVLSSNQTTPGSQLG